MADKVGIHLTQVRRYESGEAQPSLDILKRTAITFIKKPEGSLDRFRLFF
ncbi:helix-turn-helix transcriptional regulator [Dickeya fangzhongdai]|nr:helix-turn-helix transcriptional regulator [Dickeya fangzhongdai]WES87372.1 helix-turn-helix transcriptional regulator [Dickeya fangzhongdai]